MEQTVNTVTIEGDRLFTVEEVARKTRTSTRLIYQLIRDGEIPVVKFGTRLRLRWQDVVDERLQLWARG